MYYDLLLHFAHEHLNITTYNTAFIIPILHSCLDLTPKVYWAAMYTKYHRNCILCEVKVMRF